MELTGRQFSIAAGAHAATVVATGGALRRYTRDGVDITCTYGDGLPPKGVGAVLMPWPNRIRDGKYTFAGQDQQLPLTEPEAGNAIHGLGRWDRWDLVQQAAEHVSLGLDLVPQKGYPFQVRAEVTYALDPQTGLTVTLTGRNTGDVAAPFGAGSHPYLATRGAALDDVTLQLPASTTIESDDRGIPTGTRPVSEQDDFRTAAVLGARRFDQGFTDLQTSGGRGSAELRTAAGSTRLWFDDAFGFLQVYTLDDVTPGQHGIAVEPMSCAANAFNSGDGLLELAPGQSWTASWGITPLS